MTDTMTPAQKKLADTIARTDAERKATRKAKEAADEIASREQKFKRAKEIGNKYAPKFAGTRTRYQPPLASFTMDSRWVPDPREQSAPNFNEGLAAVGLRWKGTRIVADRWKPPSASKAAPTLNVTMRAKYAACAALRLSYWCDGWRGEVYAVDEHQRFVTVSVDHKRCEARQAGSSGYVKFTVPPDHGGTMDLLALDSSPQPGPDLTSDIDSVSGRELNPRLSPNYSGPLPSPKTEPDLTITREHMQVAVASIRHDPSYVEQLPIEMLRKLHTTRGTSFARDVMDIIAAELNDRRGAA